MMDITYARLAKIQRKYVVLKVHPLVLLQDRSLSVTLELVEEVAALRIGLYSEQAELLLQEEIHERATVIRRGYEIPGERRGPIRIIIEAKKKDDWFPTAEEAVYVLPNYWASFQSTKRRLESLENQYRESDPLLLRSVWAMLAYGEDLAERAKSSEPRSAWDLQRRLNVFQSRTHKVEEGTDPIAKSTGYLLRGYRSPVNGEMQIYSLYVPDDYSAETAWPLAIMLHGAWSNHHLALRRIMDRSNKPAESDEMAKRVMPKLPKVPYLVAAPNGYETMSYEGLAEEDVWRVIEEVKTLYRVDPRRQYLTGLSMGGAGTAKLALRNPHCFAAIAPVCGFFGYREDEEKSDFRPAFQKRLESMSSSHQLAENALHLPVRLMHGDVDPIVPVKGSQAMHQRLQGWGYSSELEVYRGVDHAAWVPAYKDLRIFDWFTQYAIDPAPTRIVYKCGDPYGGTCYWLRIEEAERIRHFARVEAEISEDMIHIQTENVARLSLMPPESLKGKMFTIEIDGQPAWQGFYHNERVHCVKQKEQWQAGDPPGTRLLPGRKGYITVFDERHVYAYGTSGEEQETKESRALALFKAMPGGACDVLWNVYGEEELTDELMRENHIVLFCTLKGSSFVQKHLEALPLFPEGEKIRFGDRVIEADQAITMMVPNPAHLQRYLLLNIAPTKKGLHGLRSFATSRRNIRLRMGGDFMVYNNKGMHLWGGLFDKDWKIETVEDLRREQE